MDEFTQKRLGRADVTLRELAQAVHENALAHGWWDGERNMHEVLALIHSEWSEALEEARNGMPPAYKVLAERGDDETPGRTGLLLRGEPGYDEHPGKPEGVAVELMDGCIRILDLLGSFDLKLEYRSGQEATLSDVVDGLSLLGIDDLGTLICLLHYHVSMTICQAGRNDDPDERDASNLLVCVALACDWVKRQGIDPLALLLEKHEYNKGRPYRHGKRF